MQPRGNVRGIILTMLILLLLARRESHGYDIMQKLRMITQNRIRASPGTIYPLLEQLRKKGYVKSIEKSHGKRKRKTYILTSKGKLLLKNYAIGIKNILNHIIKLIDETIPRIGKVKVGGEMEEMMKNEMKILLEIRENIDRRIMEIHKLLKERED
ncbi:MAG: PadR family transcriptional regulator [archaeon GB-1845-036]|nr:PadR family transcriptional regulator [Candidatus Culexmicrobium thermophilum]